MGCIGRNNVGRTPASRSFGCSALVGRIVLYVSLFQFICTLHLVNTDIITHHTYTNITINNTAGPLKFSDICPGVEYLYNKPNVTILQANGSDCDVHFLPNHTTHQGLVYGLCERSIFYCRLHIEVPQGMVAEARIQRLEYWCEYNVWKMWTNDNCGYQKPLLAMECDVHSLEDVIVDSSTNHMFFTFESQRLPPTKIKMEAVEMYGFVVGYVSTHSGYVILPHSDPTVLISMNVSVVEIKAPDDNVIMASFHISNHYYEGQPCFEMTYTEPTVHHTKVLQVCDTRDPPVLIFPSSCLYIGFRVFNNFVLAFGIYQKISFSFHSEVDKPQKLTNGFFNCSVDHYSGFEHHLDCNLKRQCENGQDETEHCPFSSPGCQGLVASLNKCFQYIRFSKLIGYQIVEQKCLEMGGKIASLKLRQEQNDFIHLFKRRHRFDLFIGHLSGWHSVPVMYSKLCKWSDNTLIYNLDIFFTQTLYKPSRIAMGMKTVDMGIRFNQELRRQISREVVCEIQSKSENASRPQTVEFPDLRSLPFMSTQTRHVVFDCLEGHVTHSFLLCDSTSHCGDIKQSHVCVYLDMNSTISALSLWGESSIFTIVMFKCDDDLTTVPYTLVCDFSQDCPDNSDELFCIHPPCNGFLCSNGQCVRHDQHCNGHSDCLDDFDEVSCTESHTDGFKHQVADSRKRLFINLDGTGYFIQQVMKADKSCPDTHYWCTEDWLYCLPVYTRCNEFSDCTYGEDEQDCDTATCQGFYKCRSSKVCVHGDHLCDGWGQCPQRDDEWLCDMTCPVGCLCQGYSFLCTQPFSAELFQRFRYLDATGSGMTLTNFSTNVYLNRLSLSHCSLGDILDTELPNLQYIDLANNQLKTVIMDVVNKLTNLRNVILANNPLQILIAKSFNVHYSLRTLDLSRTHLRSFNDKKCMYLPQLKSLNLSLSAIETFGHMGFKNMPAVTELDMRTNPVSHFKLDLFSKATHLKTVFSPNFRLCCAHLLPKLSAKVTCLAPHPTFSSCTQLLPTDLYRLLFLLFGICATLGNVICFLALFLRNKTFDKYFIIFYSNLHMANLGMGTNICTVTIANEIFHGNYIHFEKSWTSSLTCKVAGFLSLLSSEVSILIIFFMTLDHVTVFRFPITGWRFSQHSAATCIMIWFLGILLSVIPFLPGLSHWGLDGQSGLCRLALFDCYSCSQKFRWFTVTVVLNFILCSVFVAGEILVIRRTKICQIVVDPKMRSVHSSAHVLLKIAVIEAMCWFSFVISNVMSLRGIAVSDKIHVALVVFILSINSALSPLLYMWTVTTQQQQQIQQDKLLKILKSRLSSSSKRDR